MNPCTPGPWTVTPHDSGFYEDSSHGVFLIEEVETEATKLYEALLDAEPDSTEEQEASQQLEALQDSTARLIAAAPAMLEALRYIASLDTSQDASPAQCSAVLVAMDAIDKATQP